MATRRFGASSLHQRDSRSALFAGYTGDPTTTRRTATGGGYGYPSAYPSQPQQHPGHERPGFRPATPNRKGQYSDAVLNELESQNDAQVAGILGKVKTLKDVSPSVSFPVPSSRPAVATHAHTHRRPGGVETSRPTDRALTA